MDLFTLKHFIRYILFSRHKLGHGIHSPFAFDIVSRIFRNKIDDDIVFNIEKIRRKLIASQEVLEVDDLGAGSKKMKTRTRKVSDIVRYSSVPRKYGILLANLSKEFGRQSVLEFGTSLGISTMYMASGNPATKVITMEGCRTTASFAEESFRESGYNNIRLMQGSLDSILEREKSEMNFPGLVFIDGDHRKASLLRYFDKVADMSDRNTVVVIDDINSSHEMADAWIEIKTDARVTMTIDIFRMGIVFFRDGLTRYDYMIRY
jgi:predicted O-methyltransferase YrrM